MWLLARCADLSALKMDVTHFGHCLLMLGAIGVLFRALALLCIMVKYRRT